MGIEKFIHNFSFQGFDLNFIECCRLTLELLFLIIFRIFDRESEEPFIFSKRHKHVDIFKGSNNCIGEQKSNYILRKTCSPTQVFDVP